MVRWRFALVLGALPACNDGAIALESSTQPIVYDDDDRREYFEVTDAAARALMERSAVALVPRPNIDGQARIPAAIPTWGETDLLCPEEPFADQAAAAFCSGVLVDWDLVLTAGHCAQALASSDFVAVLGYYAVAPGELAARPEDVVRVREVLTQRRDPAAATPRLDFAWLRLARRATAPREPAPVRREAEIALGDPVIAISATGGTPLKLDAGGRIRDRRDDEQDYMVVDTDTTSGSSGGGLFNDRLELLGVLARGGIDFELMPSGCYSTVRVAGDEAQEEFTYAHRALAELCAAEPEASSLCRADCGDVCVALPPDPDDGADDPGGCSLGRPRRAGALSWLAAAGALAAAALLRRTARRAH